MSLEMIEQVLPPWTAVSSQTAETGIDVRVWARTYSFAHAPLPTSITTAGEELLISSLRLVGTLDSKPITFQRQGALLFRQNNAQAIVSGWQAKGRKPLHRSNKTR
jgi:hypothetical protein